MFLMIVSRVTTAYLARHIFLDKALAIHEVLNVRMINGLVGLAWLVEEYVIHNL
jgi:hypothetical protein